MRRLILALGLLPSLAAAEPAEDKRAAIDKLLESLRTAPTESQAALRERELIKAWMESSTAAVTLLMGRGLRDMVAGDLTDAFATFDDVVVLAPDLAEAWHQRAVARFRQGDIAGAKIDLMQTIRLEPRHFDAWKMLSGMAEAQQDWKAAYQAWEHVMELDPRTPGGEDKERDLKRRAEGDLI
jgi:Tfp pilus assembly protein PilF